MLLLILSSFVHIIGLGYYASDLFIDLFSNAYISAFIIIGVFSSFITYPIFSTTIYLKCGLSIVILFYIIMFYLYQQNNTFFFINPFSVLIILICLQIIIMVSCILTQQIKLIGIDFTSNQLSNLINYRKTINTEDVDSNNKERVTIIEEVPLIKQIPQLTFKEKLTNYKYFFFRRLPPSLLAQIYRY